MNWTTRCTAAAALLVALGACGGTDPVQVSAGGEGDDRGRNRTTLADVEEKCLSGESTPGVAIVSEDLRDSNTEVDLDDCIVHLENGAGVHLNNVVIKGGVLNIHDRDTDPSTNEVRLQRVTLEAEALLLELNDAEDSLHAEASSFHTNRGIAVRVAGTHGDANDGGFIRLVNSSLLATDPDASVTVIASESSGTVELVQTSLDTQGTALVTASVCEARLDGETLDCSAAAIADDIE